MCYNDKNKKKQFCKKKQNFKSCRSSDCGLELVHMKLESLVIANHHVAVNLYLDLVHTARHMPGVGFAWSLSLDFKLVFNFLLEKSCFLVFNFY